MQVELYPTQKSNQTIQSPWSEGSGIERERENDTRDDLNRVPFSQVYGQKGMKIEREGEKERNLRADSLVPVLLRRGDREKESKQMKKDGFFIVFEKAKDSLSFSLSCWKLKREKDFFVKIKY